MPRITMKADTLNARNADFEQAALRQPVFLNSVPKSGTHLIRNMVRMFVPVAQQYHAAFIQHPNLRQHIAALDPRRPMLSWGHLLFSDDASIALRGARHVLLVRDPYDWVLARARFFLSSNFQAELDHLKHARVPVEDVLNMMVLGIHGKAPSLYDIFTHNAAAWLGTKALIVRYEELLAHLKTLDAISAEAYFHALFSHCGIDMPEDWRERVRVGSDRKQSSTARENLTGEIAEIPNELPEAQKKLVDFHAPGLRRLLGYD